MIGLESKNFIELNTSYKLKDGWIVSMEVAKEGVKFNLNSLL
jgi:type II secretory pathway component PulK